MISGSPSKLSIYTFLEQWRQQPCSHILVSILGIRNLSPSELEAIACHFVNMTTVPSSLSPSPTSSPSPKMQPEAMHPTSKCKIGSGSAVQGDPSFGEKVLVLLWERGQSKTSAHRSSLGMSCPGEMHWSAPPPASITHTCCLFKQLRSVTIVKKV